MQIVFVQSGIRNYREKIKEGRGEKREKLSNIRVRGKEYFERRMVYSILIFSGFL